MSQRDGVYFPNLDGLRFFAFFLVFYQHGFTSYLSSVDGFKDTIVFASFEKFFNGGTGVSFFFVLSGFLITWLLLREKEATGTVHVGRFYLRRILRIWPLYYATITFLFFIFPIITDAFGEANEYGYRIAWQYLFISNFDVLRLLVQKLPSELMMNITWSISVEEQFYLIWPLLFLFVPKRYYLAIFFVVIAASSIFRETHDGLTNYFHSLGVMSDLAIGGLSAWLVTYRPDFKTWFSQLSKAGVALLYVVGFTWFFFIVDFVSHIPVLHGAERLVNASFFAFIILEQNYSIKSGVKCSKNRFITYWGKYTYGLYLLHSIAIYVTNFVLLRILGVRFDSYAIALSAGALGLLLSMGICWISYEYFEAYFLRMKDKLFVVKRDEDLQVTN